MHSSKHAEDLPAPDTPAAVKDAGSKYVYLNIQKRCIHVILIVKRVLNRRTQILVQSKNIHFNPLVNIISNIILLPSNVYGYAELENGLMFLCW